MTQTTNLKNKLATTNGNGSTAVAKTAETPAEKVRALLEKMMPEMERALPKHMTGERLARIALTNIKMTPKLLECDLTSLLGQIMVAAQLGLEPGVLGQFYLVPFRNGKTGRYEVQGIVGYQGYIELFYRTGLVETVFAGPVYENDEFDFRYGLNESLEHVPARGDRGRVTHFYAYAKMKGGSYRFFVMTVADVNKIKGRSKAKDSGPWQTDPEAMGAKTALRQLAKWMPKSVEIRGTVAEGGAPMSLAEAFAVDDSGVDYSIADAAEDTTAEVIDESTGEVIETEQTGELEFPEGLK